MSPWLKTRSGSALLIVLGMMSFMLFSGLAFSVYMRYARLPTSFLRRTTTTRQLAKAALAEAIEQIDTAIGDNPHPGVNPNGYTSGVVSNVWHHRVFFGVGGTAANNIAPNAGVPTLTLEGLAYLPPNLINDVRYYSRCTPTANWHSFWFDSGRYAYVAVDVSDYFDINRAIADAPRNSSADQRVTLAHLFEAVQESDEGFEHTGPGSGADKWDSFVENTCGSADPFISLADFNIAWNGNGPFTFGSASVKNPFKQFVDTGYAYGKNTTSDSAEAEYYRQLTFVTDSWSPAPKRTDNITVADLENETYQPFKRAELKSGSSKTLGAISENLGSSKLLSDEKYLGQKLCDLSCYALWDYLDRDKQPVSLAVPTCEQVPMICAIQPDFSGAFRFTREEGPEETVSESEKEQIVRKKVTYSLALEGVGSDLSGFVAWAYPFRLKGQDAKTDGKNDKFAMDGRISIFWVNKDLDLLTKARPANTVEGLYIKEKNEIQKGDVLNDSVLTYPFKTGSAVAPADIHSTDANVPVQELQFKAENSDKPARKLFTITYEWDKKKSSLDYKNKDQAKVLELADGKFCYFDKDFNKKDFTLDDIKKGVELKVGSAIWTRVTDGGSKTFDLVPAGILDDDTFLGVNNSDMRSYLESAAGDFPLLSLMADKSITISLDTLNPQDGVLNADYAITGKALITGDPRYNHAPENWKVVTDVSGGLADYWFNLESNYAKQQNKDGDIYMATSDQCYLQSLYELMMLPRIQTAGIKKEGIGSTGFTGAYPTEFNGRIRQGNETLKDHEFMWRTYRAGDFDGIDDGRIVSGDSGQKVNPYSDSTNVLMAAFANTPHDWRVASTNNDEVKNMAAADFNRAHAWNGYSSAKDGKLCWWCLGEAAGIFSDWVRDSADWEEAFRSMQWSTDKRKLLEGLDLDDADSDLYSVDKKFLYGFWHDSFSARQQLFLIFVRAEPMMMGGGVSGQAPPQLGARAVALVWRDPSSFADSASTKRPGTTAGVHRTRILFYHQFD